MALVEFLCNFLVIAITYCDSSKLTLSNAALLFGPIFISQDVSSAKKRSEAFNNLRKSSPQISRRGSLTPLFSRRKSNHAVKKLQNSAEELKVLMSIGVDVLHMLLENHNALFSRINLAKGFTLYQAKRDCGTKGKDDLDFKKGDIIAVFYKIDSIYGLGEVHGAVGRLNMSMVKLITIS